MTEKNNAQIHTTTFARGNEIPPDLTPPYRPAFRDVLYFFYGTLMDPKTLAHVLGRSDTPELRRCYIFAHKIMLWGEYPALVEGPLEQTVHGVVCKIESAKESDRLFSYGTDVYRVDGCTVWFDDGSSSYAETFVWSGDVSLLRNGSFDLKDWLLKRRETEILEGK